MRWAVVGNKNPGKLSLFMVRIRKTHVRNVFRIQIPGTDVYSSMIGRLSLLPFWLTDAVPPNQTTIFVLFTYKIFCGSTTRTGYKPTFKTSSVQNNKDIQRTDEGFEAYHHFLLVNSSRQIQIDDDFCIVHFKKYLRVNNKNRL